MINMMKITSLILMTFIASCSSIKERNKTRELQTKILHIINSKTMAFSRCANENKIFDHFDSDRVRVELIIMLNHQGEIERFQTDDKKYPENFIDCIYSTIDKITFPKLKHGEAVQFTQPFIFKRD